MKNNFMLFQCRIEILIYLFLSCCIITIYLPVSTFDYIHYDTPEYVFANKYVLSGLTLENIHWSLTTTYFSNWHPLTWISHMFDVEFYGLNPGQHKLNNVLFHIFNTLLLFALLKKLTGDLLPSALTAGLFAVHPLHIQSVAWIAERKDLLSGLFFLLSIMLYLRYLDRKTTGRYCLVLGCFILGLMAKPMFVTLPIILLMLDIWPLKRFAVNLPPSSASSWITSSAPGQLTAVLLEKIPFFIFSIISSVITIYAQKAGGSVASLNELPLFERISNALISYLAYLYKTIWPIELSIIYPHPGSYPLWLTVTAALTLVTISGLFLYLRNTLPHLAFGWFFFLIILIPVIGIIQVGTQALADRYMYMAIIGPFMIFSWSLKHVVEKYSSQPTLLFTTACALSLPLLIVCCSWQLKYWKDGIILFSRAISITDGNYVAHNNLGYELVQRFKFEQAQQHFAKAVQINPRFEIAHLNLGRRLIEDKKFDEGISHYLTALEIKPDYVDAHKNLGDTLMALNKNREAAYHYLQALKIDPTLSETFNNLGVILVSEKKYEEAIAMFEQAYKLNPSLLEAKMNYEQTLNQRSNSHQE